MDSMDLKQLYPLTAHVKLLEAHCDLCNGFSDQALLKIEQAIESLDTSKTVFLNQGSSVFLRAYEPLFHYLNSDKALVLWIVTAKTLPETITTILDDGYIAISVENFTGVVSSMHLIEPKAHQLQSAWLARESELADAR